MAIRGFASVLRELRSGAGTPSFRDMAARSKAISHTTLYDAVCGSRLPSWATTVEFVKACGADPADYRERWEQANVVVRATYGEHEVDRPQQHTPEPSGPSEPSELSEPSEPSEPAEPTVQRSRPTRRWWVPAGIAAVVSAVLVGWVTGIASGGASTPDRSSTSAPDAQGWEYGEAAPTAANCPIQQNDPPYFPPAHPGDSVVFVGDITLPDCTHVRRGARVVKDWRFKNDGTVPWAGYMLRRLDLPQLPNQCQTLDDIPVAYTAPGHFVDVVVEVTAPPTPGFCFVRFKLIDGAGRVAFPGNRPVNFQLIVD